VVRFASFVFRQDRIWLKAPSIPKNATRNTKDAPRIPVIAFNNDHDF
jgi:hypothetical protein